MAKVKLPSFSKGSEATLLDAENAQIIKRFLEAFNDVRIVYGNKSEFLISDTNVVIVLPPATSSTLETRIAALETLTSGLTRQTVTYCPAGGSSSSKTVLMS